MATQNFLTDSVIVKLAPRILSNNMVFGHYVMQELNKGYENGIVGSIVNFRMPMAGYSQPNNLVITPTPVVQTSIQFAVNRTETASWTYTMVDDSLSIQNWAELVIEPHLTAMAQNVDKNLSLLTRTSPNIVGINTSTGAISGGLNLSVLSTARQFMAEFCIPSNRRFGALSPLGVSELTQNSSTGSLVNLFEPSMVKEIVTQGSIGRTMGADYFESQQMSSFTTGTSLAANLSITVNSKNGDTFLTLADSASGTLVAGDIIALTGIDAINPTDYTNDLGRLRQFVVLPSGTLNNPITSYQLGVVGVQVPVACGQASAGIQVGGFPGLVPTVSALPTTATTVTYKVASHASEGAVFHREAFALVMIAPRIIPGLVESRVIDFKGMPLLYSVGADIKGLQSYGRFDALYGVLGTHPEYCIRIAHS